MDQRWWLREWRIKRAELPQGTLFDARPDVGRITFDTSLPADPLDIPERVGEAIDAQIAAKLAGGPDAPDTPHCTSRALRLVTGGGDGRSDARRGAS